MSTRLYSAVIDSLDPAALSRWWSEALGWPITFEAPDEVAIEPAGDDGAAPALVFVPVPEPKTVKNRLHLDLASDSLEDQAATVQRLVARGARPVDIGQGQVPWVVLADPEGNELCVLEPREQYRDAGPVAAIVVDAADPVALARFWQAASGWRVGFRSEAVVSLRNPSGRRPDIDFVAVTDPKWVKNRIHLDVAPTTADDHGNEVERLIGLGARRVDVGQGTNQTWVVLADPEENELCVLSPR